MHDTWTHPQEVEIQGNANLDPSYKNYFCPYLCTQEFLELRGDYVHVNDPLFVFTDGSPVKPYMVRRLLKYLLKKLNLNEKFYDTHSFRKGRAIDLMKAGYHIDQIKKLGRWRSNAVYNYLK